MTRQPNRWMHAALCALIVGLCAAPVRAEEPVEPARVVVIEMQKVLETSIRGKESKRIPVTEDMLACFRSVGQSQIAALAHDIEGDDDPEHGSEQPDIGCVRTE